MIELNIIEQVNVALKKAADEATADISSNLYPEVSRYHYKVGVIHGLTRAYQETAKIKKYILTGNKNQKLRDDEERPFKPSVEFREDEMGL